MEVHAGDVVMFDPYQVDAVLGEAQAATPHAKAGALFLIRERHLLAVVDQ